MRYYLFDDGCFYPIQSNPVKPYEHSLVFNAYSMSPNKARKLALVEFDKYVKDNKLENHCFIQWKNNGLVALPCFGDRRGDWLGAFGGQFRTQEQMTHECSMQCYREIEDKI